MIYTVEIFCPYEGIEETLILEHEKEFTREEFERMVNKALISCSMEEWLDAVEEQPDSTYLYKRGYWTKDYVGMINLNKRNYTTYSVEEYLIREYEFKKTKEMSYEIDTFTRIEKLLEKEKLR